MSIAEDMLESGEWCARCGEEITDAGEGVGHITVCDKCLEIPPTNGERDDQA